MIIDNKNINIMIVESELLFDLDLGIISYIRDNLADDSFFDLDILALPDKTIMGLLQERENKNPLSIIKKEGISNDIIDDIYKQIKDTRIKEIFKDYTASTAVFDFIINCCLGDIPTKITVICEDYEPIEDIEEVLKNNDLNINIIVKEKGKPIDTTKYTSIYLKYIDNILSYTNVNGKSIYICDILCNLEKILYENGEMVPKMEYFFELSEYNELRTLSMYEYKADNYPVG